MTGPKFCVQKLNSKRNAHTNSVPRSNSRKTHQNKQTFIASNEFHVHAVRSRGTQYSFSTNANGWMLTFFVTMKPIKKNLVRETGAREKKYHVLDFCKQALSLYIYTSFFSVWDHFSFSISDKYHWREKIKFRFRFIYTRGFFFLSLSRYSLFSGHFFPFPFSLRM